MKYKLPEGHTGTKSRVCMDCGEFKTPDQFNVVRHSRAIGGFAAMPRCKPCEKHWKYKAHIARVYGINYEEFQNLLSKQKGRCALCGCSGSGKNKDKFVVDHCHETGIVRGLLCWPCNIGLGMFKDKPELIAKVVKYLDYKT